MSIGQNQRNIILERETCLLCEDSFSFQIPNLSSDFLRKAWEGLNSLYKKNVTQWGKPPESPETAFSVRGKHNDMFYLLEISSNFSSLSNICKISVVYETEKES